MSKRLGSSALTPTMTVYLITYNDGFQIGIMAHNEAAAMKQADKTESYYRMLNPRRKVRKAMWIKPMSDNEAIRKREWASIRENNQRILSKSDKKAGASYKRRPARNKDKKEGNDD